MTQHDQETLQEWATTQRDKLSERVQKLINLANNDLYNGPLEEDEDYPGFNNACKEIQTAFEEIHTDDVWIDTQCGFVQTTEPQGQMGDNPDHDEDDPDSEPEIWYEPDWEDYVHVSSRQVVTAIVGKELAVYLV